MTSNHEYVTLPGRLVGMGRIAECNVEAVKVPAGGIANYEYISRVIFHVPEDLPDGLYAITYGGKTENVERQRGAWVAP